MRPILCGSAFLDAVYATGNCGELVKTPGLRPRAQYRFAVLRQLN
jgi:hypothetical protein